MVVDKMCLDVYIFSLHPPDCVFAKLPLGLWRGGDRQHLSFDVMFVLK